MSDLCEWMKTAKTIKKCICYAVINYSVYIFAILVNRWRLANILTTLYIFACCVIEVCEKKLKPIKSVLMTFTNLRFSIKYFQIGCNSMGRSTNLLASSPPFFLFIAFRNRNANVKNSLFQTYILSSLFWYMRIACGNLLKMQMSKCCGNLSSSS